MRITAKVLICAACIWATQCICNGQDHGIICTHGEGRFSKVSKTEVTVVVGAQKGSGFATRACEATLIWKKKETPVARGAWQVDVDVMDVDLGLGAPVVAFQVKKTDISSSMNYEIYLLRGSPQLFRTITEGDFFRAADTDMDGRVEIWAVDAGAANGFEGIPLADFDSLPTIVMRFEEQRLIDVSTEFRGYYDGQIARARAGLDPSDLRAFKNSDGRFDKIPPWETDKIRGLQNTKIKVLEVVWAYLYSGREHEAWQELAGMWPTADFNRIRASIVSARAGGISSQVDGVSQPGLSLRKLKRVHVFDLTEVKRNVDSAAASMASFPQIEPSPTDTYSEGNVTRPRTILLYTPSPPETDQVFPRSGVLVDLIIDAAGKVFSAKLVDEKDESPTSELLLAASSNWKFVPAMDHGRAVASHIRLTVSPYE